MKNVYDAPDSPRKSTMIEISNKTDVPSVYSSLVWNHQEQMTKVLLANFDYVEVDD